MNPKTSPPEPREPAARELSDHGKLLAVVTILRAKCSEREWEGLPAQLKDVLPKEIAELRAERDRLQQAHDKEECTPCECCASTIAERTRAEAAERSLLQARGELIPAVQSLLEWMPRYSIGSSGYMRQERVMKALSAPEGTTQNNYSRPIDNG